MHVVAIVLAAGSGTRMQSEVNKHLLPLAGKPVIVHTLLAFERCAAIDAIVLVTSANNMAAYRALIAEHGIGKVSRIVLGGETRQASAHNGLRAAGDCDIVLLHDGARPLIAQREIEAVIHDTAEYGGAVVAVPAKDTIIRAREGFIETQLERSTLWQVQTPQGFKAAIIREAYEAAARDGVQSTDDTGLVTRLGGAVKITPGSYANIKITTPEDLAIAEALLGEVDGRRGERMFYVGFGQDSHHFVDEGDDKPLVLGGVVIPGERGLKGNSDADVILHAVFNALTQAVGGRSIGYYCDKLCLEDGITDSREYLKIPLQMLAEKRCVINNLGVSLEGRRPRIEPWSDAIKQSLAQLLGIDVSQIGINVTSGEKLTAFGRGEGIQAFVIVSLVSTD